MEQLDLYIRQAHQKGQSDDQIRQSLIASDWNEEQINSALMGAHLPLSTAQAVTISKSNAFTKLFQGRLGRLNFILGFVYYFVATLLYMPAVAGMLTSILIFLPNPKSTIIIMGTTLIVFFNIILTVCSFSLAVRRLHDLDRSGFTALLLLVPFANLLVGIYLLLAPGSLGKNNYGTSLSSHNFFAVTNFRQL